MDKLVIYRQEEIHAIQMKWFCYGFVCSTSLAVFLLLDSFSRFIGG